MAREQGLIEPFEPGQVREVNGERIVSYGTSSYGYDVRCAEEFKIFTNIESAFVDPKAFDESSFVDKQGDVCVIPPNSFALARTIEYFRIPRNVLTICLGKSTYARCGISALRHHRQCHAARARVGGTCHARVLKHDATACKNICERRGGADAVFRIRRRVRDLVQGQGRQVPGPERGDPAKGLGSEPGSDPVLTKTAFYWYTNTLFRVGSEPGSDPGTARARKAALHPTRRCHLCIRCGLPRITWRLPGRSCVRRSAPLLQVLLANRPA